MEYNFREVEKRWQDYWAKNKTFRADNKSPKPKYYVLDMFPYPSGAGLHVGHPLGYIASDIFSRYKRHKGFNVLHPMGYDSFGLPAEQYAIQTGQHPEITTKTNIDRYREQLDKIGFSFDWEREVRTSKAGYYKWTQWIFIQLFNSWYNKQANRAEKIETLIHLFEQHGFKGTSDDVLTGDLEIYHDGFTAQEWNDFSEAAKEQVLQEFRLAYLSDTMVNWCPQLGTVLANEEVKDGVSERGGYPVERKVMRQWSLRITAYADRLLRDLEGIDWTESIKEAQRNWIGKSEGSSLRFKVLSPNPSPLERGTLDAGAASALEAGAASHGYYMTGKAEIASKLLEHAKANRKTSTETEDIIWQALRSKKLGYKFRRQHPFDGFIVDFVCLEKHLVVEIDGAYHNDEVQAAYDIERTEIINSLGFEVIRFTNDEVKADLKAVLNTIESKLNEITENSPLSEDRILEGGESNFIEVFTTRPDTLFGVSFLTLAPEHELVSEITTLEQKKAVEEYVTFATNRSERDRMSDVKKITGVFTGAYAAHPFTGKKIPIWIGDYVLAGYGTGAVMAVPAHDSRDFAFATHFGLPKPVVIQPATDWDFERESFDGKEGKLVNSDFLNGLEVKAAVKKIIEEIEARGLGKGKTNYRLRDAIFGRQRYWGEPIPVYYKDGIPHVLDETELPLILPEVDKYLPTEAGEPPLARAQGWKYKGEFEYEYSTMPGWAGSSWYYLRYMDAGNAKEFASKEALNYWKEVDLYIGGSEHATGHLLYVRFWTKFLHDLGLIPIIEPAKKLINQGMIQGVSSFVYRGNESRKFYSYKKHKLFIDAQEQGIDIKKIESTNTSSVKEILAAFEKHEKITAIHVDVNIVSNNVLDIEAFKNWREEYKDAIFVTEDNGDYICGSEVEKMSKSKWNVVSPDTMIEQYGADSLRLYEMFLGPLELSKPWSTNGITGVSNFLRKLWRLYHTKEYVFMLRDEPATQPELKVLHKTIKKITEDIERFSFNTSVSNFMICVNELTELKCNKREILEPLAILISPYAPYIAEELWEKLGHLESIAYAQFPECKQEYLIENSFSYPISINGKTKFNYEFALSLSKEELEKEVLALEQTQKLLEGKAPKKVIIVPGKIVNLVI